MAPVSPQETVDATRRADSQAESRARRLVRDGVVRTAAMTGWLALGLAGAALVLGAAAVAAGLAVGLGTMRAAGRLGGGAAARRRRRHEGWPAMVEADTG